MRGKTHVVGSLAALHLGLIGYTYVASSSQIKLLQDVEMFGHLLQLPTTLNEYILTLFSVTFFAFLLLQFGRKKMIMIYVVGLCAALYILHATSNSSFSTVLILLSFTLGTLLPDIDSEDSSLGHYFGIVSRIIPHRKVTHTIWFVILLGSISWIFESIYLAALTIGYTFHILQDTWSIHGICWFYPLMGKYVSHSNGKVVKAGRSTTFAYETGGVAEQILYLCAIITHLLCIVLFLYSMAS
ncbi:hypothetical protein ASD24_29625 [Paenibacillus sp. Root52]|uniref:metal-dependent hydrolase n=1 Tax=Paenibacillus sp. Root52 TaxID=1736552 RepID=UPI0006FE85FC|nr:metal-dependent hydrolase [Paenibacillus sp. Root52]KQY83678.1 hypothetical protein ASD24_29625 [Paenibacillus sp. Root52]